MNTIHDLGGMDGFTLPARDQDFPLREEWERQIWGLALSVWSKPIPGYPGGTRADIERIPPERYLDMPYFAKWLWAEEVAVIRGGLLSREELDNPDAYVAAVDVGDFTPATPADVVAFLQSDNSFERPATTEPRFRTGDEVVVKNNHPEGHTRCPRYTRGRRGVINRHHGVHDYQDDQPADAGKQHLYTVTFAAKELWGDRGNDNDRINAELWEIHLEPAP
ncbi:MAG: nitrile hydratase subunit beta [Gammaproteobacteria bacterium]|nr:nitrile hydratase subunit beta [Gammaproteobacteria bacterium]